MGGFGGPERTEVCLTYQSHPIVLGHTPTIISSYLGPGFGAWPEADITSGGYLSSCYCSSLILCCRRKAFTVQCSFPAVL